MRVARLGFLAGLVGSLVLGCGGGGAGPNPPPPPPPPAPGNLVKQAGDNQNGNVGEPVPVPPSVKVTSTAGAAISGVTVTFAVASGGGSLTGATPTTGSDGVATVGSWILGPAAGANTLTATISGSGVVGNPATFTATGALTAFNPTANTTLSGTKNYTTVNIPAGVTVTVQGSLTLNATGAVTIAGTLAGDCVPLTINAEGALTVSGIVDNGCAGAIPQTGLPAMTLVGKGGWTLNGSWVAAGDVTVTDDPTATDADFTAPPASGPQVRANRPPAMVGTPCNIGAGFTGTANPATTPNGADGSPNGADAPKDGATWVLRCKGGPDIIIGGLSLTGQNGGRGGHGTHSHATAAVSKGGKGAKGGTVKIQAFRDIVIGFGTINTGNGGAGGNATATGTGGGGNVGASGDATGGAGAAPGLFGAFAKTGSISFVGALTLNIGSGGGGGNATATGGDGHDAEPCPPAIGGPALATAGEGGSTPDKQLSSSGAVSGAGNVTVAGGNPGKGGDATASAGKGGKGAKPCKPGATGGAPTAKGGKGGDADLKNLAGAKVANGGNGGFMEVINGKGGQGWIDCILPIYEPGGNGGQGGTIAGFNGPFGAGLANGTAGGATYRTVANGGNGGDGVGPGSGGTPGGNSVVLNGGVAANVIQDSFKPGDPGATCPNFTMLVTPPSQTVQQGSQGSVTVNITRNGGFTGAVNVVVKDPSGNVIASGTIPAGSTSTVISFPNNLPPGTHTITVEGSAAGVPTEIVQLTLVSTAPGGGTQNVIIQNDRQAAEPWTAAILKVGNESPTSLPISSGGQVIVPVPTTDTPIQFVLQQVVNNIRRTLVHWLSSLEMISLGGSFSQRAKGSITMTVKGVPNNSSGVVYAGSNVASWPPTNTAPFNLVLPQAQTGQSINIGCTRFDASLNPLSKVLSEGTVANGGTYECDFAGPNVKPYTGVSLDVTGVSPGTSLFLSGGLNRNGIPTQIYAKSFMAPSTIYYASAGGDLPAGTIQYETVGRVTSSAFEARTYYFQNPQAWSVALPPAYNTPTISIISSSPYYDFQVNQVTQPEYLNGWFLFYTQANQFGGTNEVNHAVLPGYFGGSIPGTIMFRTPTFPQLDVAYMIKPGMGSVSGSIVGYGANPNPFQVPQVGNTTTFAGRLNLIF